MRWRGDQLSDKGIMQKKAAAKKSQPAAVAKTYLRGPGGRWPDKQLANQLLRNSLPNNKESLGPGEEYGFANQG